MEGRENEEESLRRAQLFEILAHPTRIMILRSLQSNPMSFAELKRALIIESSGNLQHHLGKLGDLVKQTEDGKYAITDDAKEALRLLDVMEQARGQGPIAAVPWESRKTRLSLFSLLAISVVLLLLVFYGYSLLAKSVPLFEPFDFSKQVLDFMGGKYDYLMLTTTDLQDGTRIAFHGATFTYVDTSQYLYLTRPNITLRAGGIQTNATIGNFTIFAEQEENLTKIVFSLHASVPVSVTSWSLIYPRYFKVEFENGEVEKIPILTWPSTYAANSLVNLHRSSLYVLYNISLVNGKTLPFTISIEDLNLFELRAGSKVYAFQIGPDTIMLLVRDDK